jgi:hypothetical protein
MRTMVTSALFLGSFVAMTSGSAAAQDTPAPPAASAQAAPSTSPTSADSAAAAPDPANAPPANTAKKPGAPMAGYAYDDKSTTAKPSTHRSRYRKSGPVVNMPGFEATDDGGSRLFVQLSQSVPVEERKGKSSITYVLKGASPRVSNNTNALVTVHFNTPVTKARLVPHGKDLHFVIDLRAAATPTWKMSDGPDKTSTLTIEFPKGDFVAQAADEPADEAAEGAPASTAHAAAAPASTPAATAAPTTGRQRRH